MRAWLLLLLAACRTSLPGASLSGRVIVTGESAAGISVSASGAQTASTITDEDGNYFLGDLVLGSYTVSATVRSTLERTRVVTLTANGPSDVPELRFTPAGELEGRATRGGAATGNAGILVTVEGQSGAGITDDSGQYHISLQPTGTFDLDAQLTGFRAGRAAAQKVLWDQTTQVPEIDLVIGAGHAALRGVALLHGSTMHAGTNVVVNGTGLTTITDNDGNWFIDGVPEGTYSLSFTNSVYQETVPAVEALPGSEGFVIDESLYALPRSPLTLFAARRIQATRGYNNGFALSPDGTRLLYGDTLVSQLQSVAVDGGGVITLAQNWYGQIDSYGPGAVFSPDSATVAFLRGDLDVVAAGGGAPSRVAYAAWSILFAPSGGLLGYLATDPVSGINGLFATTYPGGKPRLLVADAKMAYPHWSGDGSHLIYRTNIDDYWQLGTVRLVASSAGSPVDIAGGAWDPIMRPDGRYALVQSDVNTNDASSNLLSVDLASGTVAQLGSGVNHYDSTLFAGSTRVVFRQNKTVYSVPIAGGNPTSLGDGTGIKVSSDGSRVAYVTDCVQYSYPCTLWAVPTVGGTPQMVGSKVYDYAFSNDGNQMEFTTDRDDKGFAAMWVSAVGGTPSQLDSGVYTYNSQFTVDGSHLLYAKDVTSDSHGSLWVAPVGGGAPSTLGRDLEVYSGVMAPDGGHLAFAQKPIAGTRSLWLGPLDGKPPVPVIDWVSSYQFSSRGALVARRSGAAPPYRFQDGFYVLQP